MTANVELLNRVMDRIEGAAPGEWDQSSWCKCFAGQTAQELGYHTEWRFDELGHSQAVGFAFGKVRSVVGIAWEALGLSRDERYELFDGTNTKEELRDIVSRITQRVMAEEMEVADEVPMIVDRALASV